MRDVIRVIYNRKRGNCIRYGGNYKDGYKS